MVAAPTMRRERQGLLLVASGLSVAVPRPAAPEPPVPLPLLSTIQSGRRRCRSSRRFIGSLEARHGCENEPWTPDPLATTSNRYLGSERASCMAS